MADAGFFKGTSAEQDSRFANKQKKLLKQMKFAENIDVKIDMLKISFDVVKPWITQRLQELLGVEDDVVIEFVFNQLEEKNPDPKMMQINLTGFLGGSKARLFIGELWKLLASAQLSPDGIPAELVEMKKRDLLKRQEEDDRLREIRRREEESHRQEIKTEMEKFDGKSSGRNQIPPTSSKARNENGVYKSRAFHGENRRRSTERTRRPRDSPKPKTQHPEKKPARSVSISSDSENDRHHRQEKVKSTSTRYRSHSRSPIKSSRKQQERSSFSTTNTSNQATKKASPTRSSSASTVGHPSKKPTDKKSKKQAASVPLKEAVSSKSKKSRKPSKRTRSPRSSGSRSSSFSSTSSTSSTEAKVKKSKKTKRSPSPNRSRKSEKEKDDHKSRKESKSSPRKHHRSNDNKRKSDRDHPDKSRSKRSYRNESSKKRISNTPDRKSLLVSSPKKPRLESQIRVQTPPPRSSSNDHKAEQQVVPIKPNQTGRIVVLEESRSDSTTSPSTCTSMTNKSVPKGHNNSSEDENEIDLRERLLREKAIKSMKRRQSSTTNSDINPKTTNDRIVYETQ